MKPILRSLLLLVFLAPAAFAATFQSGSPSTTNNDDSCDIAQFPAATLLLPYFEVDVNAPIATAKTTLFTIVNTTRQPQIADVTIWTDWGYPVLNFDVFLTGYDVQALNLYDILARGLIAPTTGTSNRTTPGARSAPNTANPNFLPSAAENCSNAFSVIPAQLAADVRSALTAGTNSSCGTTHIGGTHANAIGYVTVNLVATCSPKLITDPDFFSELLFDNVLTGDYQQVDPNPVTGNYAGGNPLVHIRAVPEGGAAGSITATNLPYTFWDSFNPSGQKTRDRRQPLPVAFMTRWIEGGTGTFNTKIQLWREGLRAGNSCATVADNSLMAVTQTVRFDERENPTILVSFAPVTTPVVSNNSITGSIFPPASTSGDVAGWVYMNLQNGNQTRLSQNWATVTMSAEGRYSALWDATMLSNGCTAPPPFD